MAIEIVDLPIEHGGSFQFAMLIQAFSPSCSISYIIYELLSIRYYHITNN